MGSLSNVFVEQTVSVIEVDVEAIDSVSSFSVFLLEETARGNMGSFSKFPNGVVIVSLVAFCTLFFFLLKVLKKSGAKQRMDINAQPIHYMKCKCRIILLYSPFTHEDIV